MPALHRQPNTRARNGPTTYPVALVSRARESSDWDNDLAAARPLERKVHAALDNHPRISHLADYTSEMDALDFHFRFERADVHLDLKEKWQRSGAQTADLWPETPRDELFVVDETAFRKLVWEQGLGYLLVHDRPRQRWHVFGPWELCLGPRRRFDRLGNRTGQDFLKGKLLLDFRTASATTSELEIDALLKVVRESRAALHRVRAIPVRSEADLPVLPRPAQPTDSNPSPARAVEPVAHPDTEPDPEWSGLSRELVNAVKAKSGWARPTAAQRAAIPAILQGRNVLILSPTAGGKTEAALLPLLDLHRQQGWGAACPSILAISPLKALLDDQLERWRSATALVGASAFAWHGDVGIDAKKAFKDDPDDALLTTPESLELLLTSPSHDERSLFAGLRAVVIDEVHAFVGTARGAQLASLLERLFQFVEADFQRIGLSATVGAPEKALGWVTGGSLREAELVVGGAPMQGEDVSIRTYADEAEALKAVTDATSDHRSIVFTRSRRRAEQLAHLMGAPVHHSSIAAEDRDAVIKALRQGSLRCLVATSGLEMGIDIGDLDLVVHDGAPTSPSSYLQRLGRAGRKTGQRRLVFTLGEPDDLLLVLGILVRVRRNGLEQVDPQRGARLVLGQQALAATCQSFIADRAQLGETLRWSPTFAGLDGDIEATIDHLLADRWLQGDGDRLVLGPKGQERFGGSRGVVNLLATFQSFAGATVVDESGRKVCTVDWSEVDERDRGRRGGGLVVSGRSWTVVRIDREEGILVVKPGEGGEPPSWRGPMVEVERATWEAVREVLGSTDVPLDADDRAHEWLRSQRATWADRLADPVRAVGASTVVDSFCGVPVHRAALAALEMDGHAEGASCELVGGLPALAQRARSLLGSFDAVLDTEAGRVAPQLQVRYPELVPPAVLLAEARRFHVDSDGLHRFLTLLAEA